MTVDVQFEDITKLGAPKKNIDGNTMFIEFSKNLMILYFASVLLMFIFT